MWGRNDQMDVNKWKKNLERYNITPEQFEKEKRELSKRFKKEAFDGDIIWSLFNKLILKNANDFQKLSSIYYEMAIFLNEEGKNSYDMKYQSTKMQLLDLKQNGAKKVRWVASVGTRTCKKCESLNGKNYSIEKALKEMPLPLKDCKNLEDGCRCCWVPVVEL